MPNASENAGANPANVIIEEATLPEPAVSEDDLARHFVKESVSISLKYYLSSCECFSDWQPKELKKFTGIIEKISGYDVGQLQRAKALCDSHKGGPSYERFRRPESISDDVLFYELKVDPSNKARVHGFFVEGVFFLVWLDRKHQCFDR